MPPSIHPASKPLLKPIPEPQASTPLEQLTGIITPFLTQNSTYATVSDQQQTNAQQLWQQLCKQKSHEHPDCDPVLNTLLVIRDLRNKFDNTPQRINIHQTTLKQEFDQRFCFIQQDNEFFPYIRQEVNHNWLAPEGESYTLQLGNTGIAANDLPDMMHCDQDKEGETLSRTQNGNSMHFLYGSNPNAHTQREDQQEHIDHLTKLLKHADELASQPDARLSLDVPVTLWLKTITQKSEQKKLVAAIVFRMPFDKDLEKNASYRQLCYRVACDLGFKDLFPQTECTIPGLRLQRTSDADIEEHHLNQACQTLQAGIPKTPKEKSAFYSALKTLFTEDFSEVTNPALRTLLATRKARRQSAKPLTHIIEYRTTFDNALSFRANGDNQCDLHWDNEAIGATRPITPAQLPNLIHSNGQYNIDQWSDLASKICGAYQTLQKIGGTYASNSDDYAFSEVQNVLNSIKTDLQAVTDDRTRQRIIIGATQSLLNPCHDQETYIKDIIRIAQAIDLPAYTQAAEACIQSFAPEAVAEFNDSMNKWHAQRTIESSINTLKSALTDPISGSGNAENNAATQSPAESIKTSWDTLMEDRTLGIPTEEAYRVPFILVNLRAACGAKAFQKLCFHAQTTEEGNSVWQPGFQEHWTKTFYPITQSAHLTPFMRADNPPSHDTPQNHWSADNPYQPSNTTGSASDALCEFQELLTNLKNYLSPPNEGKASEIRNHNSNKKPIALHVIGASPLWETMPEEYRTAAIMHTAFCFLDDAEPQPGLETQAQYIQRVEDIAKAIHQPSCYQAAAALVHPFSEERSQQLTEQSKLSALVPAEVLKADASMLSNNSLTEWLKELREDPSAPAIYQVLHDHKAEIKNIEQAQIHAFLQQILLLQYPEGCACDTISFQLINLASLINCPTAYQASIDILKKIGEPNQFINILTTKLEACE